MQIQTKYNIGDTVWVLLNNKAQKMKILNIFINVFQEKDYFFIEQSKIKIEYTIENINFKDLKVSENAIRDAKEELIELL